ncbi:MAG: FmdB family transcriptional regulator [Candidatus Eremiobacteraeota bacterium]|nr:FmdB family transcriptional regulator [Candidatus Eremiobacteraeota bacterium]
MFGGNGLPIYEYQCVDCGTVTDIKHAFKEPMNDVCAKCGGALKRLFHAAGIVFKGSGFYVTDSRKSSTSSSDKSSGEKSANASSGEKSGGDKSGGDKTGGDKSASASTGTASSGESSASASSPLSPTAAKSEGAAKGSGGKSDAAA